MFGVRFFLRFRFWRSWFRVYDYIRFEVQDIKNLVSKGLEGSRQSLRITAGFEVQGVLFGD